MKKYKKQIKNKNLDLLSIKALVNLFINEEIKNIQSLKKEKIHIAKVIKIILSKISKGGRIIYIGAGTSGRLGILDASECKPTFSTNIFKAILAGGPGAITNAKENVEDSTKAAVSDLKKIKLTRNDVLIGISASGETPYVLSAIKFARKLRTITIGISSNPNSTLVKITHYKITPNSGLEIISGSSRLKSGTTQKIIFNMLSSISMIKSGKVYENLMIDVAPKNKKLIKRAIGIISVICKVPLNKAKGLFTKSDKNTKAAIVMHCKGCSLKTAKEFLKKSKGNLRPLIG